MSSWSKSDDLPNNKTAGKVRQGDRTQDCLLEMSPRIGPLINPPPKTRFQKRLQELQEAIYESRQTARCPELPDGLDPDKTTFGVKLLRSSNVGEILNPNKTSAQVEEEAQKGHKMYLRSHSSYSTGERVNRNYDLKSYRKDNRFGMVTPHRSDGQNTKKSLHWLANEEQGGSAQLISNRCDDFRQRTQPQIGKAPYPFRIRNNPRFRDDEMFVWPSPHHSGAGDLIYTMPCSKLREGPGRKNMLVSVVSEQLRNINYENLPSLLRAFRYYDEKGLGKIDEEVLRKVCYEFHLNLGEFLLGELIDYCDVDKDGMINFVEFASFLTWKDKMPISQEEQRILTREQKPSTVSAISPRAEAQEADTEKQARPKLLVKCEDLGPVKVGSNLKKNRTLSRTQASPERFITSSSAICATVGDLAADDNRTYGVPSVRTDLAVPGVKRVSDQTNYGEEGTAYELLFPSPFPLEEKQFFSPRTMNEIWHIFQNAGWKISRPMCSQAWHLASRRHPDGIVSLESFNDAFCKLNS